MFYFLCYIKLSVINFPKRIGYKILLNSVINSFNSSHYTLKIKFLEKKGFTQKLWIKYLKRSQKTI